MLRVSLENQAAASKVLKGSQVGQALDILNTSQVSLLKNKKSVCANSCICAKIIYSEPTMLPAGEHIYLMTIIFPEAKIIQNPSAEKENGVMGNTSFQL